MFRQQATATNLKWDTVNSSLYTVTFGAQSARAAPVLLPSQQSKGGGADTYKRQQRSTPRPAVVSRGTVGVAGLSVSLYVRLKAA